MPPREQGARRKGSGERASRRRGRWGGRAAGGRGARWRARVPPREQGVRRKGSGEGVEVRGGGGGRASRGRAGAPGGRRGGRFPGLLLPSAALEAVGQGIQGCEIIRRRGRRGGVGVRVVAPEEPAVGPGQGEGQGPAPGCEAGRRRQMGRASAALRGRGGELPEEAGGLRCEAPEDVECEGDEVHDGLAARVA